MDGVILAAGQGKRLRPLTESIPKALIKVGTHTLAEHILLGMASVGVDNVVFVTGFMGSRVENFFARGNQWELATSFVEQQQLSGTAAALALVEEVVTTNPFYCAYGDVYVADIRNYRRFLDFHLSGGFEFSIMCNPVDDPYEGSAVALDGDKVVKLVEKPPQGTSESKLNARGIMLLNYKIFDYIADLSPGAGGELVLTDAIAAAVEDGVSVGGYVLDGFSSDVGTPERLDEARDVANHTVEHEAETV
ncbi:nucleotidyltransferase family protein [bacterium]|nr:nucleotidyltransferase family protein [bacterium]